MNLRYTFKWPDEVVWLGLGTGISAILQAMFEGDVIIWPTPVEISVVAFIPFLARFIGGLVIPTPTEREAIASYREAIDDKPEPLP